MIDTLRNLFRTRRSTESPSQPSGHACAEIVDNVSLPTPLLTELIALHAHTRHLGWLSEREHCPEQYQLLARALLQDVLDGWRAQTHGYGCLDDLIEPRPHTYRQAPDTRCGSLVTQSQPQMTTREFT
ncbi:hypothetical protein OG887_44525 (plasmid) [Streptomyces sp. NBC_00053]|uniref:hypothetical protein n=1 Tax=unclassified Streptomyces TaxID=2593676 RepID=UPI0022525457|nr:MULTISPECIES: hypothetical protein [unclassified Streptomyces]MCX4399948.1 hypothetical protein [Streptomyces sp. NBC_01767]MCX5506048.1 hypothetical protein [Streptomyces sp. NBC_00052]MCX5554297.1 hypothetical protein [Streptomyces sp. NBC_00051]WSP52951.1 hypothetical protein OG348_45710 [Streptomyces sp. NBC_01243]